MTLSSSKSIAEELLDAMSVHCYDTCMGNLMPTHCVNLKQFNRDRIPNRYWVNTKRSVTAANHVIPHTIFEIFGEYSSQDGPEVCDSMVGWAYNNYHSLEVCTKAAMEQQNTTLKQWIKFMQDERNPGDEIAIYILAKMYRCHIFVYTKMFWWTTLLYTPLVKESDLIGKCDLKLVYIKPGVFGKLKLIWPPIKLDSVPSAKKSDDACNDNTQQGEPVIPESDNPTASAVTETTGSVVTPGSNTGASLNVIPWNA